MQNVIAPKEKRFGNNRAKDLISGQAMCSWRAVSLRSFCLFSGKRRFGGFCGAADVRVHFRGNEISALVRKLLGNSILAFSLGAVSNGTPVGGHVPGPCLYRPVGFLKDYRRATTVTRSRVYEAFLPLNSAAAEPRNIA